MIESTVIDKKLLSKKRSVKDLADYIKIKSGASPNYSLFLGAGASVTSGIRTGHELVQEWREEIFSRFSQEPYSSAAKAREWLAEQHPDWYDQNNEYSSLFEKKFDLPSQRRRFVELQVDKKLPSIGYAYLVELFESKFFDTVFTTNFDDLINEAFYQFSSDRPLLCAHDSSIKGVSITSSRPKIIKLHGDYLFDSIKSSLRETESLENNTREKLIEFTKEYGMIFVGYAGNDNSIMDILKYLLKQDDYLRNGIYWCRRKNDQITPELFKLLNHEKVYWVEIDGFDEFMAELVHELGIELSLGGNQKSTKRERIINYFIEDNHHLVKNEFIHLDLSKIKKHTLTRDISSLINELSQSDTNDQRIPEEDFKNLLFIDNLIREKSYNHAEEKLKELISNATNDNIKSKFLRRLIEIKEDQKDTKSALEYSDKLIELDEFSISYSLSRTNIFPNVKDKIVYLKGLLDKFKYSVNLKNHLCRIALTHLSCNDESLITFNNINKLIEESLRQSSSLENHAWRIKYDAIKSEHQSTHDKKECNALISELLERIKEINPTHDTYLQIYADFSGSSHTKEDIIKCIATLTDIYKSSSKNKKRNILKYLTKLHLSLFETEYDEETPKLMKQFIDDYEEEKDISKIAPFIIFKARYEIGCNKNINTGISLAKEAMESPWRNNYIESIIDILLIDKNNIPLVEDLIDTLPRDISNIVVLKLKSDVSNLKKEYDQSINFLNEAYNEGWDLSDYTLGVAYTNLLAKRYKETIKVINDNIDKVKNYREKDVLIINREIANKNLGKELKKHEILSIVAHQKSKGDIAMCAFYLLDDEKHASKQLETLINQDYMNYFRYSAWPALPTNALLHYNQEVSNAA
ncbi:SIR2 family protein [Enterobacteriaceae bacterium RIT814]|nr:SIR2 family protein [Enterobacteriaceae bacterium RIT 814]